MVTVCFGQSPIYSNAQTILYLHVFIITIFCQYIISSYSCSGLINFIRLWAYAINVIKMICFFWRLRNQRVHKKLLWKNKKMVSKQAKFDMVNFVANVDLFKFTTLVNNKALIRIILTMKFQSRSFWHMHECYELFVHGSSQQIVILLSFSTDALKTS